MNRYSKIKQLGTGNFITGYTVSFFEGLASHPKDVRTYKTITTAHRAQRKWIAA